MRRWRAHMLQEIDKRCLVKRSTHIGVERLVPAIEEGKFRGRRGGGKGEGEMAREIVTPAGTCALRVAARGPCGKHVGAWVGRWKVVVGGRGEGGRGHQRRKRFAGWRRTRPGRIPLPSSSRDSHAD